MLKITAGIAACGLAALAVCRAVTPGAAEMADNPSAGETRIDLNRSSARTVTYSDALVLGLVEGVTEYLPISSTGHLILASHLLGLDSTEPAARPDGKIVLAMRNGVYEQPTLKSVVDSYNIIIQGGAILAVLVLYWPRVLSLVKGLFGRDPAGQNLLRNLLISFVPAAGLGLVADHWIEEHLFSYATVAYGLAAGAFIMLGVEYWRKRRAPVEPAGPGPDLQELSIPQALLIGLCQCLSLWPGMSRSMTTIVGGYLAGLRPARAAEYSFLLGLITLSAASGYKALKHGPELKAVLQIGPLAFGIAVAAVTAALAVKWLVGWLTRHGLGVFAWYRLALAAVVLLAMKG